MIGIDISDQTIKVVHFSQHQKKLLSHCMGIIPPGVVKNGVVVDRKKMEEVIIAILKTCNIPLNIKDSVIASIPETQSFLRVIQIPKMDEFEIHEAVRWEIAQHIPFGLENVYIDWQPSFSQSHEVKEGYMEVEVGAAQKKVVDPLYEIMSDIGLDIAACELESQAIVRSLIPRNRSIKKGVLIIDIGNTSTNVIVYNFGATRFTASLTQGVVQLLRDVDPKDAKTIIENLSALPKDLSSRVESKISVVAHTLVKDVFEIVKFYNNIDEKQGVQEIILTGGGANLPGLDVVFLKYFTNVHIQRGNPWINILEGEHALTPPLDVNDSVRFATAIGLGMRSIIPL